VAGLPSSNEEDGRPASEYSPLTDVSSLSDETCGVGCVSEAANRGLPAQEVASALPILRAAAKKQSGLLEQTLSQALSILGEVPQRPHGEEGGSLGSFGFEALRSGSVGSGGEAVATPQGPQAWEAVAAGQPQQVRTAAVMSAASPLRKRDGGAPGPEEGPRLTSLAEARCRARGAAQADQSLQPLESEVEAGAGDALPKTRPRSRGRRVGAARLHSVRRGVSGSEDRL